MTIITPNWPAPANVRAYATTRLGGVSKPPWDGFNLAGHVGDAPDAVAANRATLTKRLNLPAVPCWLEQVHGDEVYLKNIDYSPTGQIETMTYGNDVTTEYAYDPETLRLANLMTHSPQGLIQDLRYQFDNVGNIKEIDDHVNTATQSFIYDGLDRLIQAQGSYGSFTYAYDSIGNMLSKEGKQFRPGRSRYGFYVIRDFTDVKKIEEAEATGETMESDYENAIAEARHSGDYDVLSKLLAGEEGKEDPEETAEEGESTEEAA